MLCPNYRGSTGYGDKFVTDLIGHENDIEVKDILAGIQHLIKEGIADPERIGVMGWSNGGYLTNCLITLKDPPIKFKAAQSGAGIVDTVAEWGFNDEPAYPRVFKKGLPWETPDIYRKTSPTYGLGNVKTPTLIHVGGNDERCPPGHSRMLYRALKEYLNVPTRTGRLPRRAARPDEALQPQGEDGVGPGVVREVFEASNGQLGGEGFRSRRSRPWALEYNPFRGKSPLSVHAEGVRFHSPGSRVFSALLEEEARPQSLACFYLAQFFTTNGSFDFAGSTSGPSS